MDQKPKICWITATYFLDVDIPVVPMLREFFHIDWIIVSSPANKESDVKYLESKSCRPYNMKLLTSAFYQTATRNFYRNLVREIALKNYDLYYLDISDYFWLYPLVKRYLPLDRVVIATHNVTTPRGARLYLLADLSMRYITRTFRNFQVFSKNQKAALLRRNPKANILECPLMLKDYGNRDAKGTEDDITTFLFFGNILRYKRLDLLLKAVEILKRRDMPPFKVIIAGGCRKKVWDTKYLPLIKHPELFELDIRRITNEKVAEYFLRSHYFVMPYQDIAQSGAMTVAFNYNRPVICSELDTFKEFIDDGKDGFFVKPKDAVSLADTMQKALMQTSDEYANMKEAQKLRVSQTLSPEVIISRYKDFFNSMLLTNADSRNS